MNEHVSQHYDASDIQVLEGLEAVKGLVCILELLVQEGYII